jgi:hypothetical protein
MLNLFVDMADGMIGTPPPTPPTRKAAVLARQKQKKLTTSSSKKKHKVIHLVIEKREEDERKNHSNLKKKIPTQKKCLLKNLSSTTSSPVGTVNITLDDLCKKQIMATSSIEPCTDKTLTFLQKARKQNLPIRSGKWKQEEEQYLRKLVQLYRFGLLDQVEEGASMRSWLAKMLNCCPMRISKKQTAGEKFKGKSKFRKDFERIENMTQQQYEKNCKELYFLRARLLRVYVIEKLNKNKEIIRKSELDQWFSIVLQGVPLPRIMKGPKIIENEQTTPPFVGTIQRLLQVTSCHELSQKLAKQVRDDDEYDNEVALGNHFEPKSYRKDIDLFKRNLKFEVDRVSSPTKLNYENINDWCVKSKKKESCFLPEGEKKISIKNQDFSIPSSQDCRALSPVSISCSEQLSYTDEEADEDLQKAMDLCAEDLEVYNDHYGITSSSKQPSSDCSIIEPHMPVLQSGPMSPNILENGYLLDESYSSSKIVVDFGVPSMHSTQAINPEWTQSSVFGDFYWTPTPMIKTTIQSHYMCTMNNSNKSHFLHPIRSAI